MTRDDILNFRPDPETARRLRELAEANRRSLADELRAASDIYVILHDLARVRSNPTTPRQVRERILDRLKLTFGQIMLAAVSPEVDGQFEDDLAVEYPTDRFGPIDVPFEAMLDWLVNGKPRPQ